MVKRAVAIFAFTDRDDAALERARERLELTAALLSLYEIRVAVQAKGSLTASTGNEYSRGSIRWIRCRESRN